MTAADGAGEPQELAAVGASRAQKPGQAPIVLGLWPTAAGAPGAVHVDAGPTSAPVTGPAPGHTLRPRVGITARVFVGARGLVQATGKAARPPAGGRSMTARTTPPVRRRLHAQGLRAEWWTPHVQDVAHGTVRLIRRRRAALRPPATRRRADPRAKRPHLLTTRHAGLPTAPRATPAAGLQTLRAGVTRPTRDTCVPVSGPAGPLTAMREATAQAEAVRLEGCSVLATAVPQTALEAHTVHDRDRDLQEGAQDVRPMTTGRWAVRPRGGRNARRPRAPGWGTRWAWNVGRALRRARVTAVGTTADAPMAVTVAEALVACARLGRLTSPVPGTAVVRWPTPDERPAAILPAGGTPFFLG